MVGLTAMSALIENAALARGLGGKPGPMLWYLTRATAESAYIALALSVALGLLRSIAMSAGERLSWVIDELHAFIATLAGLFVAGHLLTIALDAYVPFALANILLPSAQPYKTFAVNLGIFGFYTVTLLLVSSWLRRRIPHRLWRLIHYLSFIAFILVTAHGWLAGSDTNEPWQRSIYAGATAAIAFLTLLRVWPSRARRATRKVAAPAR